MNQQKVLLLGKHQCRQRVNRIAYQIYEDNQAEKEIILAGIYENGFLLAGLLKKVIESISPLKVRITEIHLDKHTHQNNARIGIPGEELTGRSVVVVDDVFNSGKTMMYALKPFLNEEIKKLRTVVLIDRSHKSFPVAADFVGLSLATTLKEFVSVEFSEGEPSAYLS